MYLPRLERTCCLHLYLCHQSTSLTKKLRPSSVSLTNPTHTCFRRTTQPQVLADLQGLHRPPTNSRDIVSSEAKTLTLVMCIKHGPPDLVDEVPLPALFYHAEKQASQDVWAHEGRLQWRSNQSSTMSSTRSSSQRSNGKKPIAHVCQSQTSLPIPSSASDACVIQDFSLAASPWAPSFSSLSETTNS